MIFSIHYFFVTSGICATGVLMGVFVTEYSDASQLELSTLYLIMPTTAMLIRPWLCSLADRQRAHKKYLMLYLAVFAVGYLPFIILPYLGPRVYVDHSRICWYCIVICKIVGDIGMGAVLPLGDSLAVNYAERINEDPCGFRKWGTISWGTFGIIIGQINEVWFLPKYVGGFLVLCGSLLVDILLIWLWPDEYFVMVPNQASIQNQQSKDKQKKDQKHDYQDLMEFSEIWKHAKNKLLFNKNQPKPILHARYATKEQSNIHNIKSISPSITNFANSATDNIDATKISDLQVYPQKETIDKRIQNLILWTLIKKDMRVMVYFFLLIFAGIAMNLFSFFFIYLAKLCQTNNTCNFSKLAGYVQLVPAFVEFFYLVYVTEIKKKIGRLNLLAFGFAIQGIRFSFYATYFEHVNPYWAIISESLQGVAFGTYFIILAEVANELANEVKYLLPGLVRSGKIDEKTVNMSALLVCIPSTMQGFYSSAMDGLGRAIGALICGAVLNSYSFHTLWTVIGYGANSLAIVVLVGNLIFSTWLDVKPSFLRRQTTEAIKL